MGDIIDYNDHRLHQIISKLEHKVVYLYTIR